MQNNLTEHSKTKEQRPSWDEYFLLIVDAVSKRATCDRGKSGCVITKNNRILATGYVGAPSGVSDCYQEGHLLKKLTYENGETSTHCVRTVHAEQNAIAQAAKYGTSVDKATLYCTMEPCFNCAKIIVASGINRVVCSHMYHAAQDTREMFNEANILLEVVNKQVLSY